MDAAAFLATVRSPLWMPNPQAWRWQTPEGHFQGICPVDITNARPGLVNLMWLALDLAKPPAVPFDARDLSLFKWVVWRACDERLGPHTLESLAEMHTLEQFATAASRLPGHTAIGQLGRLAMKRLADAHA